MYEPMRYISSLQAGDPMGTARDEFERFVTQLDYFIVKEVRHHLTTVVRAESG